jgi:hypothetical protein
MNEHGTSVSTAALLIVVLSVTACNHVQGKTSAQVIARPTPQQQTPPSAPVTSPPPSSPALNPSAPQARQSPDPKVVASDHSQTLTVAEQSFRLLTRVQTIEGTNNETVESWELRDPHDHVVYREIFPIAFENGSFESTLAISGSAFTTKQGSGLLIHGLELPSAPGSGGWLRLFGYKYGRDKYGADPSLFISFGPPIMIDGEFLDVDTDSSRPSPVSFSGGATLTVMRDILKFRLWTGNFHIVYPVLINWISGQLQPAWRCIESTSKGYIDRCSYPITVEPSRENDPTFVRLFPQPDDSFTPKHVIVQPQSKIEYLEARTPIAWNDDSKSIYFSVAGDVWIKIRIDGAEGWIHSQEDFEAVGLPQAG